jgi:hypothetical protein
LSDQRERLRRGITPDPLPDGESEEVRRGEHPPGFLAFKFFICSKLSLKFFDSRQAAFEFIG